MRRSPPPDLTSMSVEDLLELARTARLPLLEPLKQELRTRSGDEDRDRLWRCLRDDPVHGRVKAAASALGAMGDERVLALVRLDGADGGLVHWIGGCKPADVEIGMRVKAVLEPKSKRKGGLSDIRHFAPA